MWSTRLVIINLILLIFSVVVPTLASDTSLVSPSEIKTITLPADDINLALRRTADQLLRAVGDSTSRIPAVEQSGDRTWRVFVNQSFEYKFLAPILQASLDQYGIDQPYTVTIRDCANSLIELGYSQIDFKRDSVIPCGTRVMPEGCHYIEVVFTGPQKAKSFLAGNGKYIFSLIGLLGIGGLITWWQLNRKRLKNVESALNGSEAKWISFGQSKLHVSSPILESGGVRHELTFREAKLLRLFASNPGQLLERDQILQQVWEDEGVQVTRSVDVFVSRLRKKLSADPMLSIVAVHGVGYKLETELVSSQ
ncbi:MAG TPA: helix-turn-helix domain-containing protein [Saprospiraceae bacterium]|nr:helix-turn-helix domain-containing protein [Saprospiraceae bacterium]